MSIDVRQQLSLYVPTDTAGPIEQVRQRVDPVQHGLIPAHITLCREDELLAAAAGLGARLQNLQAAPLVLKFGRARRFATHGILLECTAGEAQFRALREQLLGSCDIRHQAPHLTLAHPRNPRVAGNRLQTALTLPASLSVVLPSFHLIEQIGAAPWRIIQSWDLRG